MNGIAKLAFLTAFCLFVVVTGREVPEEGRAVSRSKRGLWDGIVGTVTCTPRVIEAAQQCGKDLDEKVKGRENDNSRDMKCCMYAEYRRCVHSAATKDCGNDASQVVDTVVRGIQSTLTQDCEQYQYYSPTCIGIIWFNYIILGSIVFAILAVGCCLGSCCCRS